MHPIRKFLLVCSGKRLVVLRTICVYRRLSAAISFELLRSSNEKAGNARPSSPLSPLASRPPSGSVSRQVMNLGEINILPRCRLGLDRADLEHEVRVFLDIARRRGEHEVRVL